jgi:WD40 repeat protein
MSSDIRSAATPCLYLPSSLAQMALYWHLAVRWSLSLKYPCSRDPSQAADNVAKIWSPFSGELIRNLNGHTKGLSDISWSPDSVYLATASDDHTIRIWDVDSVRTTREIGKVWY